MGASEMSDLELLHVELVHCRVQLNELSAEVNLLLGATPTETSALEDAARRMRDIAERLEATTRAIAKASRGSPQQAN
jgi:hypothetical protein